MENTNYTPWTVAVGLLKDKGVYLSKRLNTKTFPDMWQFAGGKLEDNELPIYGAIRETKEETGLEFPYDRLDYACSIVGDPTTKVCYTYLVHLNDDEIPKKMEDLATEWSWFPFSEAIKLPLLPGLKELIGQLIKK